MQSLHITIAHKSLILASLSEILEQWKPDEGEGFILVYISMKTIQLL